MNETGSKNKQTSPYKDSTIQRLNPLSTEICILAGGLSKRMGRDKSRLRFGPTTMLGHIRKVARATGLPVRIVRRDCVPKCGPLGGIYTALKTTKADAILFLACDMPLVSTELIQLILSQAGAQTPVPSMESRPQPASSAAIQNDQALDSKTCSLCTLFTHSRGRAGFPFLLPREAIETVQRQIKAGDLSLQGLAKSVRAKTFQPARSWFQQFININTPDDWVDVRSRFPHLQQRHTTRRLSHIEK